MLEGVFPKRLSSNYGQATFEYSSFSSSNCEESEEDDND